MLQNKLNIFVACFTIALRLAKENHLFFICFYDILYKLNRNLLKEVHWCHNVINMERLLLTSVNHTSQRYWEVSQYTAVSRKVFRRNAYATIPKGNMGYDQYTVCNDWSCRTYFCCFPLVLANICPWPPVPFFQISLKNSALKATHNTFGDCRVHFFRQPFSK